MSSDTKERILNSALDIFARDGYAGTNIKVYSYMSADNIPSQKTSMSYGAVFEKEYKDETGEIIQVFVLSKDKD